MVTIRPMTPDDLGFAAHCTATEGWASETRAEFAGHLAHPASRGLVAEADGLPIGICVATSYGEDGFVGELIVVKEMRRQGVGRRLLDQAVAYLHSRGAQRVYLDGVQAAVPLYERAGFRRVCRSLRLGGDVLGAVAPSVRPLREADLPAVVALDHEAFGAGRSFFLTRRLALYPDLCWVLQVGGGIGGYIMGRPAGGAVSAGPWVVRDGLPQPERLLAALATKAPEGIVLGVLESNAQAADLVRSLGLAGHPAPPWRMVLGETGHLGASAACYAIGSAAKG